jgi:hypothetical protein
MQSNLVGVDPLGLILNGTFINSTLAIGHTQYRYVILEVYYNGFTFFPGGFRGTA